MPENQKLRKHGNVVTLFEINAKRDLKLNFGTAINSRVTRQRSIRGGLSTSVFFLFVFFLIYKHFFCTF